MDVPEQIKINGYTFVKEPSRGHYRRGAPDAKNPERWAHRYVWFQQHGAVGNGFVIHHKNEMKWDNSPENLQRMSIKEHDEHHKHDKHTDNSKLLEKVKLRLEFLPDKQNIKVLEAFGGDGVTWDNVEKFTDKKITRLRIDKKDDQKGVYLKGDNIKHLRSLDLSLFDVIDLDAYGSPFSQLEEVFLNDFKGVVIITFLQSGKGEISHGFLRNYGYSQEMINKDRMLFTGKAMAIMDKYLFDNGVKKIKGVFSKKKNYFGFQI